MIFERVLFALKPGSRDLFLGRSERFAREVVHHEGLRSIRAASHPDSDSTVVLLILWESTADYTRHRTMPDTISWHGDIKEYLAGPVDREFFEIIDGFFDERPW